jgi:hypothetical protein
MENQTADNNKKVLLILDDCGNDVVQEKTAKDVYHKLIANSRHLNISIVWLCQKITQAPTYARANVDCFISFASLATREREALYNEVSLTDRKTFARMFSEACSDQYSTFSATFRDGKLRYFKNLQEEIKNTNNTKQEQ